MGGLMGKAIMQIDRDAVNRLMPMHLWLSATGQIENVGPTLCKAFAGTGLDGAAFFDLFEVRRPGRILSINDLRRRQGERLTIVPKPGVGRPLLWGIAVPLAAGGGVLMNLSFGSGVVEAVREHQLTGADFAATDLAMELLYLVEAKTAVTTELRQLNLRLQGARDEAKEQALTDTLTGLRNRRALDYAMQNLIDYLVPFSLMHIDLDYFKSVNDTLGHAAGDFVLREVAKSLTSHTRSGDTVARVGGDEFVIIFKGLTDPAQLSSIAERVVERLSQPHDFQGELCRISASIGITISTDYYPPVAEQMLNDADTALYASKNAGRGQAKLFRLDRRAVGD